MATRQRAVVLAYMVVQARVCAKLPM